MGVSSLVAWLGPYPNSLEVCVRFLPCGVGGYVIWGGINVLKVSLQDRWNLVTINASVRFVEFLGYPKGSAAELLDGSLKLRYCTTVFTKQFPPRFYRGWVEGLVIEDLLPLVISWIVWPSPGYSDAYSVGTPKWAFCGETLAKLHFRPHFPPWLDVLLCVTRGLSSFSGRLAIWMLHTGRAGHPGPGSWCFLSGQLSIEFVNVGGWLTCGDLALDSCAQFLAVAEHRLIPPRVRSIGHSLRKAGHQSVWSLPVRIRLLVVMLGLGWSAWVTLLLPYLPLFPLSFRNSLR